MVVDGRLHRRPPTFVTLLLLSGSWGDTSVTKVEGGGER